MKFILFNCYLSQYYEVLKSYKQISLNNEDIIFIDSSAIGDAAIQKAKDDEIDIYKKLLERNTTLTNCLQSSDKIVNKIQQIISYPFMFIRDEANSLNNKEIDIFIELHLVALLCNHA